MHEYTLTHLCDATLLRDLANMANQNCATTARLIAHIAEVDARRLYAQAGYPSMFAYCVEELHFSEDAAYKRIRAARAARRFPILFTEIAEGRLHMAAVCLLSPHLTEENIDELIRMTTHRRKAEIEEMIVQRFPSAAVASRECASVIRPIGDPGSAERIHLGSDPKASETDQLVLGPVGDGSSGGEVAPGPTADGLNGRQLVPGPVAHGQHEGHLTLGPVTSERIALEPGPNASNGRESEPGKSVEAGSSRPEPTKVRAGTRFLVRLTIEEATHDKLRRVQALLSHALPTGDVAQVLDRALDALLEKLETRKLGSATRRTHRRAAENQPIRRRLPAKSRSTTRNRYIPAQVRRAVWERDQGQCTFVGANGHRCGARRFLEFDHVEPVARGGRATVEGMRLRCRAHNQYEAERAFGAEFMSRKRREVRQRAAAP